MKILRALSVSIVLACATTPALQAQLLLHPPTLPPGCEALAVPAGNRVSLHAYAFGVQVYRWNGTSSTWDFVEPSAMLIGHNGSQCVSAIHYAGPTWQTTAGSKVVGSRLQGCSPSLTAVPWLLLRAVSTQGPDVLGTTTYIQRVRTTGGLAPARNGTANEVVGVSYTAEYYFYRAG